MTTMQTAVLYLRVSTDIQAQQGTSLESQEIVCYRKAQELGVRVLDVIRDEGVSGALYYTREGIQKALNYLESGAASILIVAKLDRAGRDVDALRDIRRRVNKVGELVFADGVQFAANATGNLLFNINSSFAEYEKETVKERLHGGTRQRAEQGKQPCRNRPPFGYYLPQFDDVVRGTYTAEQVGTYIIVEEQARYVREIFTRFVSGISLRKICAWLDAESVRPNKGGAHWTHGSLHYILQNPVYKGTGRWRNEQTLTDETRAEKGYSVKHRIPAPEGETVYIPAPALVTEEVWNQCQQQCTRNRERQGGNPSRRYMLSGIARCILCGGKMCAKSDKHHLYYRCKTAKNGGQCVDRYYRADFVEPLVKEFVEEVAAHPELLHNAALAYDKVEAVGKDTNGERARLQAEWDALNKREQATIQAQIAGIAAGAAVDAYNAVFADIAATRTRLKKQIDALPIEGSNIAERSAKTIAEKAAEILQDVHLVLNAPEVSDVVKNELLSRVVDTVKPNEEGAEITLLPSSLTHLSVQTGVRVHRALMCCDYLNQTFGA